MAIKRTDFLLVAKQPSTRRNPAARDCHATTVDKNVDKNQRDDYISREKKTPLNDIVSGVLGGFLNLKVNSDVFLILFATNTIYYIRTGVLLETKHFTVIRYRPPTTRLSRGDPHMCTRTFPLA